MKKIAYYSIPAMVLSIFCLKIQAQTLPQELRSALPIAALSGQAKLRFLGFEIYQATLWVTPGFSDAAYEKSSFALDLAYLRDFKGADIAKRSISEMLRQGPIDTELQARWEGQMRALFPDVKKGDRITGINQRGVGAAFWSNGQYLGEISDPTFAKLFFGVWLATQTSQPQLRQALLAQPNTLPAGSRVP